MPQADIAKLDLNLLKLLEALFASPSITEAGARVGLSQPAASRALARLRVAFADPLFVRDRERLVATPRAERARESVLQALRDIRQAFEPEGFDPVAASGSFRMIAPDYESVVTLPALLERLSRDAPSLDIEVQARRDGVLEALARNAADIALGAYEAPAGFRRQRLYAETFVCVLRRGHPALTRELTHKRFLGLEHALVTLDGAASALAERAIAQRIVLRIPHFLAVPLIVAQSNLVATLPRRLAEAFARTGALALVAPPLALPGFDVFALWHERRHTDPRHAWLRTTLADATRGGPVPGRGSSARSRR